MSFRLTSNWGETTQSEKEACIEKASEACQVICEVIALNASEELFQAMNSSSYIHVSEELVGLMTAYKNATTRNLKLQILSIYAHYYPAKTLMKLHEPYAKITMWQIGQVRFHAQQSGPRNIIEIQKPNLTISSPLQTDYIFTKMWHTEHESLSSILDKR